MNPPHKLDALLESTKALEEYDEARADIIGQNGNDGAHYDPVARPAHYQLLPGVEVIDVRDALLDKLDASNKVSLTAREVDYWSRAWEYLTRFMDKGGREDLRKAEQYLHRLNTGEWPR